ncbi:MAG: AMP-binding protein, partial [Planctomycetes bacterium]|nr:AMP-binding protein [Planctomycetota bacterium]
LLYPSGHVYRSRYEDLRGNSAVETILKALPNVRVVLVRTRGLWGSSFSWASGNAPKIARIVRSGLVKVLLNAIFFMPRREVTIEFYEPEDLPRKADRETINSSIENFFNQDAPPNTFVPYMFYRAGKNEERREPATGIQRGHVENVPAATRKIVLDYLHEQVGISDISDDNHLARDLGMDSLARADLIVFIEKEFGFPGGDVEALQTVGDVLLAACGESISALVDELKSIPAKWFLEEAQPRRISIDADTTVTEAFLRRAMVTPGKAILADQNSGVKTYRDVVTAVLALRKPIARLDGDTVGIMLPACVAADIVFLAVLFAGKTPVMLNWTVGRRNMTHSLDLVNVNSVLTSETLVSRLTGEGTDFGQLIERFVFLERVGKGLSHFDKLAAFLKARFCPSVLLKQKPRPTAVVLFTSGSESFPKAVPLTHANLMANLHDICGWARMFSNDRLMSILPSFHSFGLTVGVLMPLCGGMGVVHHPNPTEAPMLARLIEAYRATILIGTPTFVSGIVRASTREQMASLRLAVTGGEKCPDRVYEALRARCGEAVILEGYGVTECSPVITINDENAPVPGSIGKVMPSLEHVIVDLESNAEAPLGQAGMLMVAGPSVFDGYLNYHGDTPFVEFQGKQWYRTGDLVSADANGVLTFRGRLKRFVKLGGEMISLPAIEAVLNEHYATADDEGPVLAVEAAAGRERPELVLFTTRVLDRETVNRQIRDKGLSPLHNIRRIILLEEMPLLGTGKTDYRSLRELLQK